MNPSGPAPLPSLFHGRKNSFAVTPDGHVLPAAAYDPNSWQVFVEVA